MNWRRSGSATAFRYGACTFGWSLGGVFAGLVGVFLTPTYGWQILYFVGTMSIPLTLVVHAMLPESPKFLAARGRVEELRALMSRLRPERRAVYENAVFRTTEHTASQNTIAALLAPRYRRVSLTIWLTAFLTLFAIFGLIGWIPTVMIKRGESFRGVLWLWRADAGDVLHRWPGAGHACRPRICRHAAAARCVVGDRRHCGRHAGVRQRSRFNFAVVAIAGFCVIGAQHVLNNFTANSYETGLRASGVGMELGVGRVGGILGPYVIGLLQQATGGPDAVFWAIGGAAIVAAAGDRLALDGRRNGHRGERCAGRVAFTNGFRRVALRDWLLRKNRRGKK